MHYIKTTFFFLYCWIFAITQKNRKKKSLFEDFDRTLFIAHRGLRSLHLENTKKALESSFEAGADGVEFDVQLSKDLVSMVFHDRELSRLIVNAQETIDIYNAQDLALMKQQSKKYTESYPITTLAEILSVMPAKKMINIELKETTSIFGNVGIFKILETIKPYKNKLLIVISSFEPKILEMVNKADPDYALGFLIDKEHTLCAYVRGIKLLNKIDYINPHIELVNVKTSKWIKKMGVNLIFWGHKKMDNEHYLINDKHTAIISDIPEELIKTVL